MNTHPPRNKRLFLYDIPQSDAGFLSELGGDAVCFSASPQVGNCVGCFGCWVKTPGACVRHDRCSVMPDLLSKSKEFIIISPVLYGGYSVPVKAVLDRSIAYLLPYFRIIEGEMHHQLRHEGTFHLTVHFYGACDDEEMRMARCLVQANALNLGAEAYSVTFHDSIQSVREALV